MSDPAILERLLAHRTVGGVPREQLEWLANAGQLKTLEKGGILTTSGLPVDGLFVVFDGHLSIHVDRGTGPRLVMEFHGGDVTGMLPYSRLKTPPGDVVAEKHTEVLMLDLPGIARMIRECHELTAVMVHVMIDRARVFKSSELLDEKMASLGQLAAGLAHELNNPASAVARSAKALVSELDTLDEATKRFCLLNLSDTQCFSIAELRDLRADAPVGGSTLEAADREDALADWLSARHIDGVPLEPLAASAFAPTDLEQLSAAVGVQNLGTVLAHISAGQTVRRLASEINAAASRIHALVAAVKGFTYMDQQSARQPIDVVRGLQDTITVLGSKARTKSVHVELELDADLPRIDGFGGELNQVWANLLDNAIDASRHGRVRIIATAPLGKLVVRVIDDGPGVPPAVLARIFDPFFTTKPVGEGTGLGLDIARRIVQRHHGAIDVISGDQGSEFRVTLPVSQDSTPAS
jgi:signal transduction histidine kinase